jgi:lipoprotein-anchoring transpeptidase ErfK/SrfK
LNRQGSRAFALYKALPATTSCGVPHAIFFHHGFAIHGTNDISRLGGRASHGCVGLHPANAATLFAVVKGDGPRNMRIEISN